MTRDEPSHTLPAWLQDEPQPDAPTSTARRGLRRVARSAPQHVSESLAAESPEPVAPRPDERAEPNLEALAAAEVSWISGTAAAPVAAPVTAPLVASVPFTVPSPKETQPPAPAPEVDPPEIERSSVEGPQDSGGADVVEQTPVEQSEDEVEPSADVDDRDVHPPEADSPGASSVTTAFGTAASDTLGEQAFDDDRWSTGSFGHQPSNLDLASGVLVRRSRRSPSGGWRRSVHRLSGGLLNPGESADGSHHDELVARIRQPIGGDYRIAVLSLKGGVGKTTTTVGLGSTFASLRGDCVIAVDANPDFGTLAQRIPQQTDATVRDLLAAAPRIERYSDVRAHTSQAPSRLEVLGSERDPAVSEAFSEDDYRRIIDILQVFYNVILTDCGTGIMHSAMRGVLDLANALVLVGSPAVDGARSAAATLDWLQAHGFDELVERTVVVISSPRPGTSSIDMEAVTGHFLARCRAVQVVPFDEHLAEGAEIDLNLLRPATRRAFVELAAMVADDFPVLSGRHAAQW